MFYDATYFLVIIGAIICMIASANVQSTYRKYAKVASLMGWTGAEAAEKMLNYMGIFDVKIEHIRGELTDHYDPTAKVLRLSDAVYASNSVAALGVAAHECGHAVQHAQEYRPLQIRSKLVPAANIGSRYGLWIVILGLIFGGYGSVLATVGVVLFSLGVLFQLVTLPVEFDASNRGLEMLRKFGMLQGDEMVSCRKVLQAAALTYVAAAASSILQLLRLIMISGAGSRRRD